MTKQLRHSITIGMCNDDYSKLKTYNACSSDLNSLLTDTPLDAPCTNLIVGKVKINLLFYYCGIKIVRLSVVVLDGRERPAGSGSAAIGQSQTNSLK